MKFIACEIDNQHLHRYAKLLRAFKNSIQTNCPSDSLEVKTIDLSEYKEAHHIKNSYYCNSAKLMYWAEKVSEETDNLCLIDGDTVVLKDMNHVFDLDFDIAYTQRSKGERLPINGGVLFIKPSEKVVSFMREWSRINNLMLKDVNFHRIWYNIYNGMNQASFGYMLEHHKDLKIISLPCAKYNACDPQNWVNVDDDTHVIHIKSALREVCLLGMDVPLYKKAVDIWKSYANPK